MSDPGTDSAGRNGSLRKGMTFNRHQGGRAYPC